MQNTQKVVITLLSLNSVLLFVIVLRMLKPKQHSYESSGKCSADTCSALDPVNEPAYNMKNIIQQSILLEEHLAEKNKYCISCICKHFSHIIGLANEAVWMAGKDTEKYPYLRESPAYYQDQFDIWLAHRQDETIRLEVLDAMRQRRRDLINVYYLQ